MIYEAAAAHLQLKVERQRIDDRDSHSMQAAGHLVAIMVELAAGMQSGQYDLSGRNLLFGMGVDGNAPAIVRDGDGIIEVDRQADLVTEAGQGLVDRVVHHLLYQMMEPCRSGGADVHGGPFLNRLEAFQDTDLLGCVGTDLLSQRC